MNIKYVSLFSTLDGEVTQDGPLQWSQFIRFGGCNLRCWKSSGFCDAPHSLDLNRNYPEISVNGLVAEIHKRQIPRVTITGGEPLMQYEAAVELGNALAEILVDTTLETSGSIMIDHHDTAAFDCIVCDLKPPSTEMCHKMIPELMAQLGMSDYVKAVIQTMEDLQWFDNFLAENPTDAQVAIGPRWIGKEQAIEPAELVDWMRTHEKWDWRLNLQLHKYIWPDVVAPTVASLDDVNYDALVKGEV